jgi:alpha-amylase/alpha-mannosidase (GH57 family)
MSESLAPVDLVLLWHHHQPDYRRPTDGRSVLPWARLHAGKDYLDMARHLDRHPGVRATFNLVPSLVDQIEGVERGEPDDLFELLARPPSTLSTAERATVAWRCTHVPPRAVERWPALRALRERAAGARADARTVRGAVGGGLGDRDLIALEIWFLLAWVDPMFHGEPEAAGALADPERWSERERDGLIALHRRLAAQVIPAYRALAERGRIELSTSPYHHPILPLLVDLASARRARPQIALPAERLAAPEDARRQIERALERHAAAFGARPAGMWPSEGSVSPEAVALAAAAGVRWMASDEGVLFASLPDGGRDRGALYRPWRLATADGEVTLFFRDRALSDRIGFVYQRWDEREAAADFIAHLRRIARDHAGATPPVVSVILDGENCWEHYRDDGDPFLDALYGALEAAPDIRTRTPSDLLGDPARAGVLARLHSGSWIDADFHIWIGHPEKNRAWEAVARARRALVEAGTTPESAPVAWQALDRAEGSDWFWWFGDDHHTPDRPVFDRLFRDLLTVAYEGAGLAPPATLRLPIARARGGPGTETVPVGFVTPTIDGRRTAFYEWHSAGRFRLGAGGSMHRAAGLVRELHYGFDAERFYLRLDFSGPAPPGEALDLGLEMIEPRPARLRVVGLAPGERAVVGTATGGEERPIAGAECRIGTLLELAVPFASAGLAAGEPVALLVQALRDGRPVENYPGEEGLSFTVPGPDFEAEMWSA